MAKNTKLELKQDPVQKAREEIATWVNQACEAFPERAPIIHALITCAIVRTNIILYGPPGTAKSLLARAFAAAIQGKSFDVLMTRYTTPNELFGPTDVQALKVGRMSRVWKGYLPSAHVAFLDEGFKANSACLNSLLTAVNEHLFHDDGVNIEIPLLVAIIASNEFPDDNDNLNAIDDRFPLRFDVGPLQNPDNFKAMVTGSLPKITATISMGSIQLLADEANLVSMDDSATDALWGLREKLMAKGIYVSDRKLHMAGRLLCARAALNGSPTVTSAHLGLLEHILWLRPDQKRVVTELVRAHVAVWLKDLRSALEAVSECETAMAKAVKKGNNLRDAGAEIAQVGQKLKDINENVLEKLLANPDANRDVSMLRARIEKTMAKGKEHMTNLM